MKHSSGKFAVLALVLLFLSFTAVAEMDLESIQDLVQEGNFEQALTETDAVLARDKDSAQAMFLKGLIYTKMNRLDKAEEAFLQMNKTHPELPEPYNNLAVIYASQGQYEKAKDALQQAINTHPSYATAYENIGDIYAKMASHAYNQALELDNSNETAREKLSLINELFPLPATPTRTPVQVAAAPEPAPPAPEKVTTPALPPSPPPSPPPAAPVIAEPAVTAPPAPEAGQIQQTITDNIQRWAEAWSRRDVDAYLSFYAPDYTPSRDMPRHAWVAQRKLRLTEAAYIKVGISGIKITMHGGEHAQAVFLQNFQSDKYNDNVYKTLLFRNLNGRWLIVQEKSG